MTRSRKADGVGLHPEGDVPDGTKLEFSTRSGNTDQPEKTWSDWSEPKPLSTEITIASPNARFLQYRAEFRRAAGSPSATARLRRLEFYYQNGNAAPVIARVKVIVKGFGLTKMPMPQMEAPPVNLNQLLNDDGGGNAPAAPNPVAAAMVAMMGQPPLKEAKSPGACAVVWQSQ